MWFKLAGADFSKNNLGTMSSISSSYLIDYTGLTGMSGSPSSVSYAGSSAGTSKTASVVVTVTSGYTFKRGSKITASGGKSGTVFTADKDYTGGQTFTFSMAITANTKLSGTAEATGGSSSGGSGGATTNYTFTLNPTPTSATVTLSATGYSTVSGTGSKSITVANGTKVNWTVSASGYTTRTGNWTISGGNKTESITLTASSGDSEVGDGEWLSVLLTGDADAHNKFMNGNLTGAGSLTKGYDVIYTATNIQSLLEGKKIYKFASNGLDENTLTLYSNPYVGNTNTNTPEGRTEVGTVTSTSAQAIGTITEYTVNNPSAIKNGETLSISWSAKASGIRTVEGYNTPVYYLNGGVFKTALTSFCSFDFFVGE